MAGIIDNELYSLYYIENNRSQIMSDHLGSASFLTDNNGKEKDLESGYNYYGARYYYDWLSIWLSVDPMSDKYPSTSSYAYCRNNPIMLIDPDGMDDIENQTKYINNKGELLYETKDGLNDVIIIPDGNISELKETLQEKEDCGTIDDPNTNKKELHVLGLTPTQYTEQPTKGMDDYWANGYEETYEDAYKNGKSVLQNQFSLSQIFSSVISAIATENGDSSGQQRHGGRGTGITDGVYDRKAGRINRLNPLSSLKNNLPLIQLKSDRKSSYPGVGLPPR